MVSLYSGFIYSTISDLEETNELTLNNLRQVINDSIKWGYISDEIRQKRGESIDAYSDRIKRMNIVNASEIEKITKECERVYAHIMVNYKKFIQAACYFLMFSIKRQSDVKDLIDQD